jgi:hypothetical protein
MRLPIAFPRNHPLPFPLDVLLHDDLRCAARKLCPGENADAFSDFDRAIRHAASLHFSNDAKALGAIVDGHGITIHGRAIERWKIVRRNDCLTQHATARRGEPRSHRRKRLKFFRDQRASLVERNHQRTVRITVRFIQRETQGPPLDSNPRR